MLVSESSLKISSPFELPNNSPLGLSLLPSLPFCSLNPNRHNHRSLRVGLSSSRLSHYHPTRERSFLLVCPSLVPTEIHHYLKKYLLWLSAAQ